MFGVRSVGSHVLQLTGFVVPEVLVFDITHRCTSRCGGCAFREPEPGELPVTRWVELATEGRELGFTELMVTGGEPLAHPDIEALLPALRAVLPISLITNGLALRRHAALVRAHVDKVFVSWDAASEATYERIRGVRGLSAVQAGVDALRGRFVHARVTTWRDTVPELLDVRHMAEDAGCTELSLLAPDTTSGGFGERTELHNVPAGPAELPALRSFFARVEGEPFVAMSPYAKARVLRLAAGEGSAPACTAPWRSGVVDPTGRWRHCFFLESSADVRHGLRAALRASRPERRALDVGNNPVCARCVCWRG